MAWLTDKILGGIVGKIVGAIIGAIFLFFGLVPEQLIAHVIGNPPEWVGHPWTRLVVVVIGVGIIVAVFLIDRAKRTRISTIEVGSDNDAGMVTNIALPPNPFKSAPERVTLRAMLDDAEAAGWKLKTAEGVKFFDQFRQATADGVVTVYGRKAPPGWSKERRGRQPLIAIAQDYWQERAVSVIEAVYSSDNAMTYACKHNLDPNRDAEHVYWDLHVNAAEALNWLRAHGRGADESKLVPLANVAAQAYEASPKIARLWEKNTQGVLATYADFIGKHAPIFGAMPPSTHLQRVNMDGLTIKQHNNGQLAAFRLYEREVRWVDLHVPASDIPDIMARLQDMERHHFGRS